MDFRIEAFLMDVLLLEGESSNAVRERRRLIECEQFRDAEPNKRVLPVLFAILAFSKKYLAVKEREQSST
jgi:hypothetical protein